jgi:drug/metabolite transporter (DMT)-like permease
MNGLIIAVVTGFIGMFGWGTGDYFSSTGLKRKVSEEAGNFWLNFSGVVFCIIAFSIYMLLTGKSFDIPPLSLTDLLSIVVLAVMNFVAYLFFFKALREGDLSVVSSVFSTYAAGAVLVSALVFHETIPSLRLVALGIVIIGVVLVAITDVRNFKKVKGVMSVVPAVIIFSVFFPFWDSIASKGGSLVLVLILDTMLLLLYFFYARMKGKKLVYKVRLIKPFVVGGVLTTLAALAVSWGYEHTDFPSVVSVVSSAVPVTSAFLGYMILKERLTKQQYLGLATIVVGVIFLFL